MLLKFRPCNGLALVVSHNKTLAAQLYGELRQFFVDNAVEYFVSYYDYVQPEANIPATNIYIEKDLTISQELEKLRLSGIAALLTDRRNVIVVPSAFHAFMVLATLRNSAKMCYVLKFVRRFHVNSCYSIS